MMYGLFERIHQILDHYYPPKSQSQGDTVSFLKKLGTFVLKIVDAILNTNLLPLVENAVHAPASVVATVANAVDRLRAAYNAIITAEQMFAAAGQEKAGSAKLKAATPFVAALIHDVIAELKPGAKPRDEAAFEDACTRATAALADALNAYGD
jgi:hypothetical protein